MATALIFGQGGPSFYDTEFRHSNFNFLLRRHHEISIKEIRIFPYIFFLLLFLKGLPFLSDKPLKIPILVYLILQNQI